MYARVSTLQGPADQIDAGMEKIRAEIQPEVEAILGFRGILFLGDRSSGRTVAVTFWESERAMQESRQAADRIRQKAAEAESASIQAVEEYEVLLDERR